MSSTRRAEKGTPFRQERYASAAAFERGLMGNLVAKRAELLTSEQDRNLVWWLQKQSWNTGGLDKLTADLIAAFPQRFTTPSMREFGFKPGQIYNAEKVRAIRREVPHDFFAPFFPCKGETSWGKPLAPLAEWEEPDAEYERSQKYPATYPASDFVALCLDTAKKELPDTLAEMCLNPEIAIGKAEPWYFPSLTETLREHMNAAIETSRAGAVVTALGRKVGETLDYCQQSRYLVMIDGLARTGKTFSAKAWCDQRPGQARYVQVPSSNDDIGFFRAIARAVGVSINQNSKAQQLRDRIEDVLRPGHLTIVFDEAHYLWPQSNYREALPGRVNWIMTALVNQGVPVALVTTPQFMRTQKAIERKSCWTSEQFTGRIGHYEKLPDSLSEADLAAVAKVFLPEGCARSIEALALYATTSVKYLAAIGLAVSRARVNATKAHRAEVIFADVRSAIHGSAIPSDNALQFALKEPKKAGRSRAIEAPFQAPENALETPLQDARHTRPALPDTVEDLADARALGTDRQGKLVTA